MKKKWVLRYFIGAMMVLIFVGVCWLSSRPDSLLVPSNALEVREIECVQLNFFLSRRPWAFHDYPEWKDCLEAGTPRTRFEALLNPVPNTAYVFAVARADGSREEYLIFEKDDRFLVNHGFWNQYELNDFFDGFTDVAKYCYEKLYNANTKEEKYFKRAVLDWVHGNYVIEGREDEEARRIAYDKTRDYFNNNTFILSNDIR